jgi:flagellar motor switch protein FliG
VELSGAEKAAFFVLSLDEDQAATLLGKMQDDELQRLHQVAQGLRQTRLDPGVLQSIYVEFVRGVSGDLPMIWGGGDYLLGLFKRALGDDRAHNLLRAPLAPSGPLDDVAGDGKVLAEMLAGEHPQAIAAVLSQVEPSTASMVLTTLSEDQQEQVIDRMASLASISPLAIRATRDTLSTELGDSLSQSEATPGVMRAAAILNELLPEQSAAILAKIESRSPERAGAIRREQFTFEDLAKLDKRGMQVLLREVDGAQLSLAMKNAGDGVRRTILSSMSSRAAETLKEDLQNLGPQRVADVEKAQRDIVMTAVRLQGEGKLVLITGGQVV